MTTNGTLTFIRRWLFLGLALFGLGGWVARLQGAVESRATRDEVLEIRRDLEEIKASMNEVLRRQREYFCADKPDWCR